jgi:hypothetical protein
MSAPTRRSTAAIAHEQILELQIRIADLECQLANRNARIAALITAGDANGTDHTRPGWKQRWTNWMRAKGY